MEEMIEDGEGRTKLAERLNNGAQQACVCERQIGEPL